MRPYADKHANSASTIDIKLKHNSKTISVSGRRNCFISAIARYTETFQQLA